MRLMICLCLFLAFVLTHNAPAHAQFYTQGIPAGTIWCDDKFQCMKLSSSKDAILGAANACIAANFNIQNKILNGIAAFGKFIGCAVPGTAVSTEDGTLVWAVCCVKPSGNECRLSCTRYAKPPNAQ